MIVSKCVYANILVSKSKEEIKILDKVKTTGNATYSLDVCGKRMVYKQIGSVLMEASKADNMTNSLNK